MKPRQFDLIVFDWDGTLSDSTGLIVLCMQSACADIGVPVPSKEKARLLSRSTPSPCVWNTPTRAAA